MTTHSTPLSPPQTFTLTVSHAPPAPAAYPPRRSTTTQKALWFCAFALLANAGVSLYSHITGHAPDLVLDRTALAQAAPAPGAMLGARGLYMMPAQLGPNTFGLYLMDVDAETITVYRAQPDSSRFSLMSTRSFKWDVQMDDYNNSPPYPRDIQKQIETQRQRHDLTNKADVPTVEQHPKIDENAPDGTMNPMNPPANVLPNGMEPTPPVLQFPPPAEPK